MNPIPLKEKKSKRPGVLSGPANAGGPFRLVELGEGAGTADEVDDKAVCRIVGSHDKDEVSKIAASYEKKYGTSLKAAITDACQGDYRRLAVAWVDLPDQARRSFSNLPP